jgi:hypothetical protein
VSAPKATVQDLLDEGFATADFGSPEDFALADTGYLARALALAGRWVAARVTQAFYDAAQANTFACDQMARAEVHYASALLWNRRSKFLDAQAGAGLQNDQYKVLQYLGTLASNALAAAIAEAAEAIRASGGDASQSFPGSALSSGTLETGRYSPAFAPLGANDVQPFNLRELPIWW